MIAPRMNPTIPTDYAETGTWLAGFVRSHAKREDPRIESHVETEGTREGRSYGIRLSLGDRVFPPASSAPMELDFQEVAIGRTRFAWCAALGERIRAAAGELLGTARSAGLTVGGRSGP
jgi:hypothetical protein